ncbi:MAG: CoA activase, partial [Candidatus Tectomicrobia bacterium]|nr:CoA activase [Candidatus Tectomicrobia bacterium]
DLVRNEITAQATAALHLDPQVDTIFEIGGQDSKYICLQDGLVVDFTMNKVCAAGTGSFLEEQAEKLGIEIIGEFGDLARQSSQPSQLGDRCTVFMESDLVSCQNKGGRLEDLVAGLGYSIVHNYLHLVVGDRKVGQRIFFQGGVAANQAVVSAFEQVVGRPVTVPPHHDVTGAIGVALLAQKAAGDQPSRFQGFDLSQRRYTVETFICKGCENLCEINQVKFGQERQAFYGARCERYEEDQSKKLGLSLPNLLQEREELLLASLKRSQESQAPARPAPGQRAAHSGLGVGLRIGIPRALFFYEYLPFWGAFFGHLGCEVVVSEVTNQRLANLAVEHAATEICFPMKVAFAHLLSLQERELDYIFFPSVINYPQADQANPDQVAQTCPYIPTVPYLALAASNAPGQKVPLLRPILDYRWKRGYWQKALIEMGQKLGWPAKRIREAIAQGEAAQARFYQAAQTRGREVLDQLKPGERAIVLISRPYNGCDSGLNLGLFQKLKKMGILTLPMDFLPLEESTAPAPPKYNIYWLYGQKILQAAHYLKHQGRDRLYPRYLTNFGCGPDSFLMGFFKAELEGYPCLQIEVDEHNADAGLVTRCEAFLDSIEGYLSRQRPISSATPASPVPASRPTRSNGAPREIYIPYMSDSSYAVAAAFRAFGIPAQVMPESDQESLELGKQFALGKECLPFVLTLGDFLKVMRQPGFDPEKSSFFMPTSDGPCRFGMYYQRQRQIFTQQGYPDVPFISPNQGNSNGYFQEFNQFPSGFSRLAWQGIVAYELLEKLYRATRPYVADRPAIDQSYREGLQEISYGIVHQRVEPSLQEAIEQLSRFPLDASPHKPIIGIVGEIYLRSHRFGNQNLVETIEELGGEVWQSTTQEWILYVNSWLQLDSWERWDLPGFLRAYLKQKVQLRDADRLSRLLEGRLEHVHEPSTEDLLRSADPYLHRSCGTEAVVSLGRSAEFFREGASGIISVMPFTCMPGNVVNALFKRFKEDHENIPCLSLSYDGLEDTHIRTRLEAFIVQARQYQERKCRHSPGDSKRGR